jgi:hypothetical protein
MIAVQTASEHIVVLSGPAREQAVTLDEIP